jgi:hypothetical protein
MSIVSGHRDETVETFNVRLPLGLRKRIKRAAAANSRSMNSEIVAALEAAYPHQHETESINEALLEASKEVAAAWSSLLIAIGQTPDENRQLANLLQLIEAAKNGAQA